MQHVRSQSNPVLAAFLFAACASSSGRESAPVQVDELVSWIERVHVEAERSRDAVADSFERLNQLAAGRFERDSAPETFARFVQGIDAAEQQAKRFREVVGPMVTAAKPVFEQWQTDVQTIENERLRQRSQLRFAVAKERYEAIRKAAVPAQDQLDGFVRALRDHAAFLAHDLNAGAIDDIQGEVKLVAQTALELDHNMESAMAAARAYVEQSATPATAPSR